MNIGVSGLGYWGKKVLNEYLDLKNEGLIDSITIFDNSDTVRASYLKLGEAEVVGSYQDLLTNVDAVHICTPNDQHYKQISLAFDFGKCVLVEKPLTDNSKTSFISVERSLALNVIFQVGNIFRFSNALIETKKLLKSSKFGKVLHLTLHWSHIAKSVSSGNSDVVWDLMPHILDILNFILEDWPNEVSAFSQTYIADRLTRKAADIILTFDTGIVCNVILSHLNHKIHRDIEISCENGTINVDPVAQTLEILTSGIRQNLSIVKNNSLRDEILNFVGAVNDGRNKINSAFIGAIIVKEVERIIRALENGKTEKV